MRNIEALKQRKGTMVAEARGFTTLAEKENRNLTQEEKGKVDKLLGDIRDLDEDIAREERLQSLEMAHAPAAVLTVENRQKERRSAFYKFIREGRTMLNREERALVEDSTGLTLIPEDLESEIYRGLPQINVIRQLATVRQTGRDKVRKRSMTEVSVGWGKLETGSLITESTPTPTDDHIYVEDLTGLCKVGKDELMDGDDILATILADSFRTAIANEEAKRFVVGRGHTYQEPDGVTLDTTVISTYTDLITADTIVPDDLLLLQYKLPAQYRNGATWLMNSTTEGVVRTAKATSSYLWQPVPVGMPRTFDGFPIYNQNDMIVPASTNTDRSIVAVFGNWKLGYVIVDRLGVTIQRLDELYAEDGLVGFIVHFRVGGGVVRADAFRALDNNT